MGFNYELTAQRQRYLEARGFTVLTACPGSGKTTSIVRKLYDVQNYCKEQYGAHTGFACLSFTNKACDELKSKYLEMHGERLSFPNIVSTIDSFLTQYVVLPFWYLCEYCKSKPVIINEEKTMEKVYYSYYYDKVGKMCQILVPEIKKYYSEFYSKSPIFISHEQKGYKWKNSVVTDTSEVAYCEAAFFYRLKRGYITSNDALWMVCYILSRHPEVAEALAMRFPYVIVDEVQDSSELQFWFLAFLKKAGVKNMEFVGDICQCIYEFRNARPDILMRVMNREDWRNLPLSECRRSNQRIIDLYSKLKSTGVPAITSHQVTDLGIPIIIYRYDKDNIRATVAHFHQQCDRHHLVKRVVLARGNSMCKKLAGVKDTDFKYWKSHLPYLLIESKFDYEEGNIESAFRKIRVVVAEIMYDDHEYNDKKEFIRLVENDIEFNARIFSFFELIPPLSLSFCEWTTKTEELLMEYWGAPERPHFEPFQKKKGCSMPEMANVPVELYHMSSDDKSEYRKSVDTIHAVKGATLDAVLLFLSENSQGQKISLNDFPSKPVKIMTEGQRLIYVACSRASQFLALAVPSTVPDSQIRRVMKGVPYELKEIGLQRSLDF